MKYITIILVLLLVTVRVPAQSKNSDENQPRKAVCIPADIVFIADWSGSVSNMQPHIARAIRALCDNFVLSSEGIKIGIIKFDSYADIVTKCTSSDEYLLLCAKYMSEQMPGGGTDIESGLMPAFELFETSKLERGKEPKYKFLILISDGETAGANSAIETANELKQSGVIIYTIQINTNLQYPGEKEGDKILKSISSGENFHFTSSYESLYETIKTLEFCQ